MKFIGLNCCQRGDLVLNTVAARAFKEQYPDGHLTMGVEPRYADMEKLFAHHAYINAFHAYSSTGAIWPNDDDHQYLTEGKFDIIGNPYPIHPRDDWWRFVKQEQEVCIMNGLPIPKDIQCNLVQWFDVPDNKGYIALAAVGGWQDYPNKKSFSHSRAEELVAAIRALGYGVIQMGGQPEPRFEGAEKSDLDYFEMTRQMLGCKALVTVDTGRAWLAAAYSFPTVGCYSSSYYTEQYVGAIQPTNPNAKYLSSDLVGDIPIDQIIDALKETIA